ncbi:MAG: hypothetical protein CMJ94_05405 [Planctomycetes bacterium]|nr:hypothetical protein [Planctomycetota bacterium]
MLDRRVPELDAAWRRAGGAGEAPGFGLYLAAQAVAELEADAELRAAFLAAWRQSAWPVWTANAFPFGGFHGDRVKEQAFLPDWRTPERLQYTLGVARLLSELLPEGTEGSLSTCPLGYGPDARVDPRSAAQLHALGAELDALFEDSGVSLTLAIEPEPDGAMERVETLAAWLRAEVGHARIGICWDLCHAAVVGESADQVLAALQREEVALGKVQVSAALRSEAGFGAAARALTEELARDRYFHQARWSAGEQQASWPDLPPLIAEENWIERLGLADGSGELRVHCHVPLDLGAPVPGWAPTDWQSMLRAAYAAGCRDFEVETYTLPVLPESLLSAQPRAAAQAQAASLVDIMAAELRATAAEIGLDTVAADL